jgi:hypothetical protein
MELQEKGGCPVHIAQRKTKVITYNRKQQYFLNYMRHAIYSYLEHNSRSPYGNHQQIAISHHKIAHIVT